MTFYDVLNQAYVGKTIKSIVQHNAPSFHHEVARSFQGKKINKVWMNIEDIEYQKIMFEVDGIDYPLGLYLHENIELE